MLMRVLIVFSALMVAGSAVAQAQTGSANKRPAKELFGYTQGAAPLKARAIGFYARGCLAGGVQLPVSGPTWQSMRLSRNRQWGHPAMIRFIERFAKDAKEKDGWPGLMVGDISQPRGGPMGPIKSGHASHQIGLDADIWYRPMPPRTLTYEEREKTSSTPLAGYRDTRVIEKNWSDAYIKLLRRAASYRQVQRILVHPAVKKKLCTTVKGNRSWLRKIRPIWGHNYHFHIRIKCPRGSVGCRGQTNPPAGDGCGKPLTWWLKRVSTPPKPRPKPAKPSKPRKPRIRTIAWLPKACGGVIRAARNPRTSLDYGVSGDIAMPARNPRRIKGGSHAQAIPVPLSPQ